MVILICRRGKDCSIVLQKTKNTYMESLANVLQLPNCIYLCIIIDGLAHLAEVKREGKGTLSPSLDKA